MNSIKKIIDRIAFILETEQDERAYDKDVAIALGISQMNLATMKKRNKLPLEELSWFCATRRININWLLFDQSPESLIEETFKYMPLRGEAS